jgi:CheY-like chemotaxis protein
MVDSQHNADYDRFVESVRDALNHLYDPERLRQSALIPAMGLEHSQTPFFALQKVLLDTIETLQPHGKQIPVNSPQWRNYLILSRRYEQQFSQQEVADLLAVSVRQYRRFQTVAVETLAAQLYQQWPTHAQKEAAPDTRLTRAETSFSWLDELPEDQSSDCMAVLTVVTELLRPMAAAAHNQIRISDGDLPAISLNPMLLKQILLNCCNGLLLGMDHAVMTITCAVKGRSVEILITAPCALTADMRASLEVAQALTERAAAAYRLEESDQCRLTLNLPAAGAWPVLAIDDHADTLHFLERAAIGSRYQIIPLTAPEQWLSYVQRYHPQAILIDIMMPLLDGWDVLSQIRNEPLSSHLPIIVCSVLPQAALARSLSANAFLPKPVRFRDLAAVLDDLVPTSLPQRTFG